MVSLTGGAAAGVGAAASVPVVTSKDLFDEVVSVSQETRLSVPLLP